MKIGNISPRMATRLLVLPIIALIAVAVFLVWDSGGEQRAEAASTGPEISMAVTTGGTACPGGYDPNDDCVTAGDTFTLTANVIDTPVPGYIAVQTFIDYGIYDPAASEDGAGLNTCSDTIDNGGGDGADRFDTDCVTTNLTYNSQAAADEMVWPDLDPSVVFKAQVAPHVVSHGGLTGLIPPQPVSFFIGTILELSFTCSSSSSTTNVQLLPENDPLAGTSGTAFQDGTTTVIPKLSDLVVHCLGPTPTPTVTPIPATHTPTVSPTPTDTPTPLPPPSERPDVKVTKVDLTDPVDATATFTYRVTIDSVGLQTAEDVTMSDALPPGSSFVSAVSAGANCGENLGVVICTVTNPMNPSDQVVIDITVTAPSPILDTLVSNTVTVSASNEPFANTGNNTDIEETVVLAPRSDVDLTKVGDPSFVNGNENVTYTLTAANSGPQEAENVVIVDTLPLDGAFVSASPGCGAPVAGVVTCSLGNIPAGSDAFVEIVMLSPVVTQSLMMKNTAVVSADNELFVHSGNNSAIAYTPVVAPPPDLVVTKVDLADPVLRLGYYSYTITVDNIGLGDALDVVVTDTLPTATVFNFAKFNRPATFVGATGAVCVAVPVDTVECTIDEVLVSSQVIITLDVRAPTLMVDQTITNNVTASASDPDENPVGNDASETTDLKACFDVTGDLVVDLLFDILTVVQHHGEVTGDPGFDVLYDIDGDGTVSLLFDVLPVIQHHGQDCSLLL